MRFGVFDDSQREYVITQPDTPLPWINYLGCDSFFGLISNTAGGYSFYRDARLRRITRYRYNNVPADTGGRYLYLRDDVSGEYWSPTYQPTCHALEEYQCRHGLSYTKIHSVYRGIQADSLYLIPLGETLEMWQLTLENRREKPARLSLFSCVEFCLWDAQDDATNFQRNLNLAEVEVEGGVIYHKTEYRERRNHVSFFACSASLSGFDTQRDVFLGPNGGWGRPAAVERGASFNSLAHGWAPMGSHHARLVLGPGESRSVTFLLGYHENADEDKFDPPGTQVINKRKVKPVIARFLRPGAAAAALAELKAYWDGLLGVLQVQTPDEHVDRMVNCWNAYQCMVTFNLSRSASYFESGIGRGMGFRDSNQDLLGFVHMVPARARERLLDLAATQLASGGAYHQYQPLTKRGNDAVGSGFNDDPHWLILSVAAYLKETGDWGILDEVVPFDNQPGSEVPLYEHLLRSVRYTLERLGPHALPLIGRADWNDCLNLNTFSRTPGESFQTAPIKDDSVAESVFIGGLFVLSARELAEIARRHGPSSDCFWLEQSAAQMERAVREHGWDGAWFRRAYDSQGRAVGSRGCSEGQIFVEPQGICVMAGIGLDDGRAVRALESVGAQLATPHGLVLLHPAYTHYDPALGEISSYPPGVKENGGVFCHTNPWIMIAETRVGHGGRALDYYLRTNPSARESISDVHRCEPYVYAQMIAGKEAPNQGEAKNSWLTGTAAWSLVAISQWILGIRPEYEGLRISPTLPAGWAGFGARRVFRGVTFEISIERAAGKGDSQLIVDGQPIEGCVAPLPLDGRRQVRVRLLVASP